MEAQTKALKTLDFTLHFPPEIIASMFDFVAYEDIAGALAVNKLWNSLASRLIVEFICDEFFVENVSPEHTRINIQAEEDLDHSLLINYRLHCLSMFAKLELRIDYVYKSLIQDWPEHIRQLASLQNLINLELVTVPEMQCQNSWSALSVLTNLQRLSVDNASNSVCSDWLPSSLHSLQLSWATLTSKLIKTIDRMTFLSELCLDYTVAGDQLLDTLLKSIGSRLTKLVFRDRVAEGIFRHSDKVKQLQQQGPSLWRNFAVLTNLQTLRLSSTPKNGLEFISSLTQLTSLALIGYYEDINFYRSLSYFTNLRSFMTMPIDGTLILLLQSMTQLTNLEELSVTNCRHLKDEDLMELMIFPKLTRLDLVSTPKLTTASFEFLLKLTRLQQVKLQNATIWQEYNHKSKIPFSITIGVDYDAFTR